MRRIKRRTAKAGATLSQAAPPWVEQALLSAVKLQQAGQLDQAKHIYARILQDHPRHSDALYCLASIALASRELDLAAELVATAISIAPRPPYLVLQGNVLQTAGRLEDSAACYRRALAADPDSVDAHYNYANTLERQGRAEEALAHFERAVALRPDHVLAQINLASLQARLGRVAEATSRLELARSIAPNAIGVHVNLGNLYMAQGRAGDALACFDRALGLDAGAAMLHNNRGNALRDLGRLDEARQSFQRAISLAPPVAEFHVGLGVTLQSLGRLEEALSSFRAALTLGPRVAAAHSAALFALHYDPALTAEAIVEEHRRWAERHARPLDPGARPYRNTRDAQRRLRVGYVSPDFRRHPVAMLTAPLFAAHDRDAVEVVCYSDAPKPDEWTETVRRGASLWRETHGTSDAALAARIEEDAIDILVDLSGHTAGNRLLVFARKPAPVQLSWLGYFNTTGMQAMDYILVDPVINPPDEEPRFVERPLRLDGAYFCYRGPDSAPEVAPPPSLVRGHATYGCFNSFLKINRDVIGVWARILKQDATARLVLKNTTLDNPESREWCWKEFAGYGVAADRIELLGKSAHTDLLAHYARVDVALDPFPLNGGTTTCEALWMGVPVVTLAGGHFASRVGRTILQHAGCADWIARSREEYIGTALDLAADPARLARWRPELREKFRRSPIGDVEAFTRRLEHAYRKIWQDWCASGG